MIKKLTVCAFGLATLVLAGCETNETTITAAPAYDPAGLVGANGSSGEMALQSNGYVLARTQGLTSFWWNANTASCLQVITADGRYVSVDGVSSDACTAG